MLVNLVLKLFGLRLDLQKLNTFVQYSTSVAAMAASLAICAPCSQEHG